MIDYAKIYSDPSHHLHKEALRLVEKFSSDASVDENGVVTWNSNGSVPPEDILQLWAHLNLPFDYNRSVLVRGEQVTQQIEAYRRNYKGPSAEDRAEARAAHGPGVTMTNVLTGHTWTT